MDVLAFQAKWRGVELKESAAAKVHFLDLCHLLGMPDPVTSDKTGATYTFEKGATKTSGGKGFADVWFKDHFAWEYKGPNGNLEKAYGQLREYIEALENPPMLVVSDYQNFELHTNFTGRRKVVHAFTIEELSAPAKPGGRTALQQLRALWEDPYSFDPGKGDEAEVTERAAARFGAIAAGLHARAHAPERVAHYLMQLLFCLFAEDAGLLPKGLFSRLLGFGAKQPALFTKEMGLLLETMRSGGFYHTDEIARFNGGLLAVIDPLPLDAADLTELRDAAALDWSRIEPAIFGTLFERSLDPAKRSQLGAHYTGKADILRVVEPVVLAPLRRRWAAVRTAAEAKLAELEAAPPGRARQNRQAEFRAILTGFQEELRTIRILDPACGSGNFLYVTLEKLLDLEKEALTFGAANGLPMGMPLVGPRQLAGLEINTYARELAQVVVWIGYLKWKLDNGFPGHGETVLEPLETIRLQDALLDLSDPMQPREAAWPAADFIIGNPPFLGGKRIRSELGDAYTEALHAVFAGRLPPFADLVCYFFEKARAQVESESSFRAGLLATNSIRGGANRVVLDRVKATGDIFLAWDDEPWILDGAAVRISIVGFDDGTEQLRLLDGEPVQAITSALTGGVDLSGAARLRENAGVGFLGDQPTGPFDISEDVALEWSTLPLNPNGRSNAEVVRPYWTGADVTGRWQRRWIVDFGVNTSESQAALFEAPFEHVRVHVKPERAGNRERGLRERWWLHWRPRGEMRKALADAALDRFVVTPHVSKHRVFAWLPISALPNNLLIVFARQDDYFFGVLHSRAHEVWSLRMGTWLGVGNDPRYTSTTCFETFPLPWPPGQEPWRDPRLHAIAEAARALDEHRARWLNPPDLAADAPELKKRTLTNLYNARPAWLAGLHAALDRAVWAAYGWADDPAETADEAILARLLALNGERAGG